MATAILAELVLVIGHPLFGWGTQHYVKTPRPLAYAAPLPPSGQAVLSALSARAAIQTLEAASAVTPYAYVSRRWWRLPPTRRSGQRPRAGVLPTVTQSWTSPEGTGRVRSTTSAIPGSRVTDTVIRAGPPLPLLSTNEAALARRLGWGYPTATASGREFADFTALADRQPLTGPVEATILRLLARIPGVINSGNVTDRDGRPGVAVSLASGYTGKEIVYTLIFDPATGALLEADQTLNGDAGRLNVAPGAVLAYTTWLASGYVASTAALP